jgi:hypothetical protein
MTIDRCTTLATAAADRRADDTHWWKAYQTHSKAATAMNAPSGPVLPGTAGPESFRPTKTEIQRAAKKALGSP